MSAFTSPADLRLLDDYRWVLLADFAYHVGEYPSERVIVVPAGTVTDLASVPRLLWAIFPPHGKYAKAAIVHDYLYANAIGTKDEADRIFYEAMGVLGVPKWRKKIMFVAVSWFGRGSFKNAQKQPANTMHML
jgi:hypothetical protein